MSSPLVLILGAGANIGQAVARRFNANGYKVALVNRTAAQADNQALFSFKADLTNPASVKTLFEQVKASVGIPSVVIYNAALNVQSKEPFGTSLESFQQTINVNTTSVFAAAQEAVKGFEALPDELPKSFLFTGNALDEIVIPGLSSLGVGKSATAHLIKAAAGGVYSGKGYTFYYVDERQNDGRPAGVNIDGDAHADIFYELATDKKQRVWKQTFVKVRGYVEF